MWPVCRFPGQAQQPSVYRYLLFLWQLDRCACWPVYFVGCCLVRCYYYCYYVVTYYRQQCFVFAGCYRSVLVAACEHQDLLMFDPHSGKLIGSKDAAHADCVNCVRFVNTSLLLYASAFVSPCSLRAVLHPIPVQSILGPDVAKRSQIWSSF